MAEQRVDSIMQTEFPTLRLHTPIREAVALLRSSPTQAALYSAAATRAGSASTTGAPGGTVPHSP